MRDPKRPAGPTRKAFLHGLGALGLAAGWPAHALARPQGGPHSAPSAPFPRNDLERVQAVVGGSHGNIDAVRDLVTEQPALAKASWDWGFGDWETPLGAASHVGRRDIADLLIRHGARPTVFSEAMMGRVDTVRAFLTADPGLHGLHGPHGISLMRHAEAGGPDASAVVDYLLEVFGPDRAPVGYPGDDAVERRYAGRFRFDVEPAVELVVGVRNGWLMIGSGEQPSGRMLGGADDVFHPAGAPSVRLHFEMGDGRAERLTVGDGPVVATGRRVGDRPVPGQSGAPFP